MKLEETVQTILDNHPLLFKDRISVLIYIYCYYGTGYEWNNGELVSNNNPEQFQGVLPANGIAKQNISDEDVCIKYYYETFDMDVAEKVSYEEFKERINLLKKSFTERFGDNENTIEEYNNLFFKDVLKRINEIRASYIHNVSKILNEEYSNLYNLPNDIKDDWLKGAEEVKEKLRELNIL